MAMNLTLDGRIGDLQAVILDSDSLQAAVLPAIGAKIYNLIWKPKGRNILWYNPRIPHESCGIDVNFDYYWCGGWDDAFPTCDPREYRGEQYPALGELRSLHWQVKAVGEDSEKAFVKLTAFGPISPVEAEKTVPLMAKTPVLTMRYEITNLGPLPLEFIWGTHPALEAHENLILRIPAKTGMVGQATDPRLGTPGQRYAWPMLETPNGVVDMSRVQGSMPQRLVISPIWLLPVGKGQHYLNQGGLANALAGGWEVSAIVTFQAGFPFTVFSPQDFSNTGSASAQPDRYCNGKGAGTVEQFFNTSCFSVDALSAALQQGAARFGNSGRNILFGPGLNGWDIPLMKNTHICERFSLEFRAQAFNAFNTPHFGDPNTTVGTGTFGMITGAGSPRDIQFGLKLKF